MDLSNLNKDRSPRRPKSFKRRKLEALIERRLTEMDLDELKIEYARLTLQFLQQMLHGKRIDELNLLITSMRTVLIDIRNLEGELTNDRGRS